VWAIEALSAARGGEAAGAAGGFKGSWAPHAQSSPQVQTPACFVRDAGSTRQHTAGCPSRSWQQWLTWPRAGRAEQQEFAPLIPTTFAGPQQRGQRDCSADFWVELPVATVSSPQRHGAFSGGNNSDSAARETTIFEKTRCRSRATIPHPSTANGRKQRGHPAEQKGPRTLLY